MLSRYCCVITFNFPKPRFTFSCHHLRNSRLFPVAYEYLIVLPGKERHLLSSLRCIVGRVRVDQRSLGRDYVPSAGFRMTVNQEPCAFLRIPSHMGSVFILIHLHTLSLTLTDFCKLTIPAGPHTGLFISPSGISELDCSTTKTDTAERSISIGRESLQVFFFVIGALAYFQVPPLGGSREEKWRSQ